MLRQILSHIDLGSMCLPCPLPHRTGGRGLGGAIRNLKVLFQICFNNSSMIIGVKNAKSAKFTKIRVCVEIGIELAIKYPFLILVSPL